MSKKHLSRKPHSISNDHWWYEENAGMNVVVSCTDNHGNYVETKQILIRWSGIRAALKRKDKKP